MSVVFLVLPLALLLVGGAVMAFVWSARSGQFDDLDTPGLRVLHDHADTHVVSARKDEPAKQVAMTPTSNVTPP